MEFVNLKPFVVTLKSQKIWAWAAVPLLLLPAGYAMRAAGGGNAAIAATLGDPLSIFAARSPGAREIGLLAQTKLAHADHQWVGARVFAVRVSPPAVSADRAEAVDMPQPIAKAAFARPTHTVSAPGADVPLDTSQTLTDAICRRISTLGARAKGAMLEAMIVYELSQSTLPAELKALALVKVRETCPIGGLNYVVGGIARALRSGEFDGTAALNDGYGIETSDFSAPTVTLGGGSANYKPGG